MARDQRQSMVHRNMHDDPAGDSLLGLQRSDHTEEIATRNSIVQLPSKGVPPEGSGGFHEAGNILRDRYHSVQLTTPQPAVQKYNHPLRSHRWEPRTWKLVPFDVEETSPHVPRPGIYASISYFQHPDAPSSSVGISSTLNQHIRMIGTRSNDVVQKHVPQNAPARCPSRFPGDLSMLRQPPLYVSGGGREQFDLGELMPTV
ncbi:hypothetical protein BDV93DRAFT_515156 [Ceratobasidium sp. AG-I]|nr:hypothetical protein BDV93DRAFT_515156 [Ceratobasidium sp. AG-I]